MSTDQQPKTHDEVIGIYDDTKYCVPGVRYVDRKPLTPEQIEAFRPKKETQ